MLTASCGINSSISLHDFRVVQGNERTNLIFDIVVPYDYKGSSEELISKIQEAATQLDKKYYVVVDIDRSYVR